MYKLCAACHKCKKIPTFYKPSLDVVNSPYFKHVYGKTNYVYATLELYGRKPLSPPHSTPPAASAVRTYVVGGVVLGC